MEYLQKPTHIRNSSANINNKISNYTINHTTKNPTNTYFPINYSTKLQNESHRAISQDSYNLIDKYDIIPLTKNRDCLSMNNIHTHDNQLHTSITSYTESKPHAWNTTIKYLKKFYKDIDEYNKKVKKTGKKSFLYTINNGKHSSKIESINMHINNHK